MASSVQVLLIASSLCATISAANCNSSAEVCVEADETSLLQTQSTIHLGREPEADEPLKGLTVPEADLHIAVVHGIMNTVGEHSGWGGDLPFMVEDQCGRRTQQATCEKMKLDKCSGACQVHPEDNLCKPLRILPYIAYARARPDSPFGLYSKAMKSCNGRSKMSCKGDCMWKPNMWAQCVVAQPLFLETVGSDSWKTLITRVIECDVFKNDREGCHNDRCQYEPPNPFVKGMKCQLNEDDWYQMVFGRSEGGREGAALLARIKAYKPRSCGDGPWAKRCELVKQGAKKCAAKMPSSAPAALVEQGSTGNVSQPLGGSPIQKAMAYGPGGIPMHFGFGGPGGGALGHPFSHFVNLCGAQGECHMENSGCHLNAKSFNRICETGQIAPDYLLR